MAFLYKKEFISVLIDFFLEKRSPLSNANDKRVPIGNKYGNPQFDSLIQTIAVMLQRSKNRFSQSFSNFAVQNPNLTVV